MAENTPPPTAAPAVCPDCGETLSVPLETHLRQTHQVYLYRGQRRSLNDTLAVLLQAVCHPPGDRAAWRMLSAIAQEQQGPRAASFLAVSLATTLGRLKEGPRRMAVGAVARTLVQGADVTDVVAALAEQDEPAGPHLALAVAGRWRTTLPETLFARLQALLSDPRLPGAPRRAAAAALLRSCNGPEDPRETQVLEALVGGVSTSHGLHRLKRLQRQLGPRPSLLAFQQRLEQRQKMRCPRCGMELRRAEMTDHLWREHRLVLDGHKVRDPWALIEDRLLSGEKVFDPAVLEFCRGLAQQADGEAGVVRVQRLILKCGINDEAARSALLADAQLRRESVCPACFAAVPVPRPEPGHPVNVWRGRLSGQGYRLELFEGLFDRVEMATPEGPLAAPDTGRRLTQGGAQALLVGPLVLAALVIALASSDPLLPVLALLTLGLVLTVAVYLRWDVSRSARDRAVDLAWQLMVPRLHAGGYSAADAAFVGGLALVSADAGRPELRRDALLAVLALTEKAVASRGDAASSLAALRRLQVNDEAAAGRDPVAPVVAELAQCLEGRLPLAYGEALLTDWQTDWWTPGNLARLRVLLCDRAFEAGFEVRDLLGIGQSYAALGAVLEVENPQGLALLRQLWSIRATTPWDRAGEASTVFEWATRPGGEALLRDFPDLLLAQEDPVFAVAVVDPHAVVRPLQIVVTGRGVAVQGVLFTQRPREMKVVRQTGPQTEHQLWIGEQGFRFSFDPSTVAARLERWFRYLFNDFLPVVDQVFRWTSPDVGARLRARGAVPCPGCNRPVLTRIGALARRLDEPE